MKSRPPGDQQPTGRSEPAVSAHPDGAGVAISGAVVGACRKWAGVGRRTGISDEGGVRQVAGGRTMPGGVLLNVAGVTVSAGGRGVPRVRQRSASRSSGQHLEARVRGNVRSRSSLADQPQRVRIGLGVVREGDGQPGSSGVVPRSTLALRSRRDAASTPPSVTVARTQSELSRRAGGPGNSAAREPGGRLTHGRVDLRQLAARCGGHRAWRVENDHAADQNRCAGWVQRLCFGSAGFALSRELTAGRVSGGRTHPRAGVSTRRRRHLTAVKTASGDASMPRHRRR